MVVLLAIVVQGHDQQAAALSEAADHELARVHNGQVAVFKLDVFDRVGLAQRAQLVRRELDLGAFVVVPGVPRLEEARVEEMLLRDAPLFDNARLHRAAPPRPLGAREHLRQRTCHILPLSPDPVRL